MPQKTTFAPKIDVSDEMVSQFSFVIIFCRFISHSFFYCILFL